MRDPDVLELHPTSTLGLWFARGLFFVTFAMGACLMVAAVFGLAIALTTGDLEKLATSACACAGGLVLGIPGGAVAFGGGGRTVDRNRRFVASRITLFGLPARSREVPFSDVDHVRLEVIPGEVEFHAVVLGGVEPRFELFRESNAALARRRGREVARFMGKPLVDASGGEPVTVPLDALDDTFAARHPRAARPELRDLAAITFTETASGARLRFPAKGAGPLEWIVIACFALLSLPVPISLAIQALSPEPDGELVASALCYALALVALALPVAAPFVRTAWVGATVDVRDGSLVVTHHGASRRVIEVPSSDVHAIVHISRAQNAATPGRRFRPGELTLRHADGDLHLGPGQPDDDLAWAAAMLTWQLCRSPGG